MPAIFHERRTLRSAMREIDTEQRRTLRLLAVMKSVVDGWDEFAHAFYDGSLSVDHVQRFRETMIAAVQVTSVIQKELE